MRFKLLECLVIHFSSINLSYYFLYKFKSVFNYNILLNYPASLQDWNRCPHLTSPMKKLRFGGTQLLPQVSQSVSHSEKTLTLTFLLQILFTVLSTTFFISFPILMVFQFLHCFESDFLLQIPSTTQTRGCGRDSETVEEPGHLFLYQLSPHGGGEQGHMECGVGHSLLQDGQGMVHY